MKNKQFYILILLFFVIISTFVFYLLFVIIKIPGWPTRGQIGDTFGAPNAVFSALALLGVVYSIFQQNEVIKQGRIENENVLKQFNESIIQFEKQQKIQTLVNLISVYEKKTDQYRILKDTNLQIEANGKVNLFINELENLLTKK